MNRFVFQACLRAWCKCRALKRCFGAAFCCGVIFSTFWTQAAASQHTEVGSTPRITLSSAVVETGDTLLVQVDWRQMPMAVRDPAVYFDDQPIHLFPHPAGTGRVYAGIIGIALSMRPCSGRIRVAWSAGGQQHSTSAAFAIRTGAYGEETLKVDPRHVRPSPENLKRIRQEQAELKELYISGSRSRLWRDGFQIPVPGEMNGPFGTRRLFNGELQSQHSGVDFRAQTGDSVRTAADGVVCLAKDLFFSGNAVIVDHGAGVFTSYSHLSRINVSVGQRVEKGGVIGLAGATGRATGPHLHWGAKVNNVSVNPLALMRTINLLHAR